MVATSAGLPTNNQNLRRRDAQIGERTFEVVPQFTYLGSKVSNDNSMEAELHARMLATNRSFFFFFFFFFTSTTDVGQGLPVPTCRLWLSVINWLPPYSMIVSPTYGGAVYLGIEPMTGMLLSRTFECFSFFTVYSKLSIDVKCNDWHQFVNHNFL